jgi:hypothetical protein
MHEFIGSMALDALTDLAREWAKVLLDKEGELTRVVFHNYFCKKSEKWASHNGRLRRSYLE